MKACVLAVRSIANLTAACLLFLAVAYVLKSGLMVESAGITATGSLREVAVAGAVALLYVGAALLVVRTGARLSARAVSCVSRIGMALGCSVLWLCAGVLLFFPQMVVY